MVMYLCLHCNLTEVENYSFCLLQVPGEGQFNSEEVRAFQDQ